MRDAIYFESAPLEEVVCGVQFTGVNWSDIHFGLFFREIRDRYQQTHRRPPLSLVEQDSPQFSFSPDPPLPLVWYESPNTPFLLQVQKDAFLVNWRRQGDRFKYPRFRSRAKEEYGVWDYFFKEWESFCNFCKNYEIGIPEILVCHLAYIDHMVQGETWKKPSDLADWFKTLEGLRCFEPESVSTVSLTVKYERHKLPIRTNIRPAIRTSDKKKLFIFDFVITEKLSSGTTLESWFDDAHDAIVTGFVEQTTDKAHKEWGYNNV